jgi:hypothetical protein
VPIWCCPTVLTCHQPDPKGDWTAPQLLERCDAVEAGDAETLALDVEFEQAQLAGIGGLAESEVRRERDCDPFGSPIRIEASLSRA